MMSLIISKFPDMHGLKKMLTRKKWLGFEGSEKVIREYDADGKKVLKEIKEYQSGKTLWDWLQLLIVPLVLLIIGAWFTYQQNQISIKASESQRISDKKAADLKYTNDLKIAKDQQQEAALGTYINDISDLLLNKNLGKAPVATASPINIVARTKTLSALHRLDSSRKANIMQFLYESKLINKDTPVIDLTNADLNGTDFTNANFEKANLALTELARTNFYHADLIDANLEYANLSYAKLGGAFLSGANMKSANLIGAKFQNSDGTNTGPIKLFYPADLEGVNFQGAFVVRNDLTGASLQGADFSDAYITSTVFINANLTDAKFRGAFIYTSDMRGANMEGVTDLAAATIDSETIFTPQQIKQFPFLKGHVTVKELEK